VARPLPQVREDTTQDQVLDVMRVQRTQLALVRGMDEHVAVGIVTLEDVLESLHGDIREAPLSGANPASGE
jgi:CBS domain containing-hemolysin-like protein